MTQDTFEARLLHVWMTTRVPLTRANILFLTSAPRRKADKWLEELVKEGVLEFDSDAEGEMLWTVRGATRPARGYEKVEDVLRFEQLSDEVSRRPTTLSTRVRASDASGLPAAARNVASGALARAGGEKSLLASGILSLMLGPIGWLYAGPLREAIPAALLFALTFRVLTLLPLFLAGPALSLLYAASGGLGVLYAWQYNRNGRTTPLLTDDDMPRLGPGRTPGGGAR